MFKLPTTLPARYALLPGQAPALSDLDTGGYDILVGGYGFRLATDQQFQYQRYTEPTTVHRFDSSLEPGEQTLSEVPWIKAQSSFHGGAGQLNLEQGFTAFQYQAEQVEHIRFDTCLGVDVWTPGVVKRLPDCTFTTFTQSATQMVTGTVNGIDYAIVGGSQSLCQVAWNGGPDALPTITSIPLSGAVFGGTSNCTVTSLATDGTNYYGLINLKALGSTTGVLTFVIQGQLASAAAPTAIYDVPKTQAGPTRTNLSTNPGIETSTFGYSTSGGGSPAIVQSSAWANTGTKSMLFTAAAQASGSFSAPQVNYTLATVNGQTYTVQVIVKTGAGFPGGIYSGVKLVAGGVSTAEAPPDGGVHTLTVSFTATGSTATVSIIGQYEAENINGTPGGAQLTYIDSFLIETPSLQGAYFDGDSAGCSWTGTAELSTSLSPSTSPINAPGVVAWAKQRLMLGASNAVYELNANAGAHTALPGTAKYTHPISSWVWTAMAESPGAVLVAGSSGNQASILELTLDTSGNTPTLAGGAMIAQLPPGEIIYTLQNYLGSFLAMGTTYGVRIGTFDTYTGALKYGPLVLNTKSPVWGLTGRDRFVYFSYSNQQADGKSGLGRIDLSMVVDQAGRNAWAPDMRPPTSAPTGTGPTQVVAILPLANRVVYATTEGICVEGNGPGSNGDSWIRTSRIRYDTAEPKLYTVGRVHGALDVANIQVTGVYPFGISNNIGTFGFITGGTDAYVQFGLGNTLNEWMQLQFDLQGSACILNSYQVKAVPQPTRQNIIVLTANCFRQETDRFGLAVTDPQLPRQRYQNLRDLETAGGPVRFVEFTNTGSVAEIVTIDQLQFQSYSRPNIEDDFGGYVTIKMRAVA